jgi:hypothetical protein
MYGLWVMKSGDQELANAVRAGDLQIIQLEGETAAEIDDLREIADRLKRHMAAVGTPVLGARIEGSEDPTEAAP